MERFFFLVIMGLVFQAQAAKLQCELGTANEALVSNSHRVSDDYDFKTIQFNMPLEYQNIQANVYYDHKMLSLTLKGGRGESYQTLDRWSEPLEQRFVVTGEMILHDRRQNVFLSCMIDVTDKKSSNWAIFKSELDQSIRNVETKLDRILELSKANVRAGEEENKLNNGICLLIGNLIGSSEFKETQQAVVKIGALPRFSELYTRFMTKSYEPLTSLADFCANGISQSPRPIPNGNRKALAERVAETKLGFEEVLSYIERQFPNQGPSRKFSIVK